MFKMFKMFNLLNMFNMFTMRCSSTCLLGKIFKLEPAVLRVTACGGLHMMITCMMVMMTVMVMAMVMTACT